MGYPKRHDVDLHVRESKEVAQALTKYAERDFQGNLSQAMRTVFRAGLKELNLLPADAKPPAPPQPPPSKTVVTER
jgi:hypothetical protein